MSIQINNFHKDNSFLINSQDEVYSPDLAHSFRDDNERLIYCIDLYLSGGEDLIPRIRQLNPELEALKELKTCILRDNLDPFIQNGHAGVDIIEDNGDTRLIYPPLNDHFLFNDQKGIVLIQGRAHSPSRELILNAKAPVIAKILEAKEKISEKDLSSLLAWFLQHGQAEENNADLFACFLQKGGADLCLGALRNQEGAEVLYSLIQKQKAPENLLPFLENKGLFTQDQEDALRKQLKEAFGAISLGNCNLAMWQEKEPYLRQLLPLLKDPELDQVLSKYAHFNERDFESLFKEIFSTRPFSQAVSKGLIQQVGVSRLIILVANLPKELSDSEKSWLIGRLGSSKAKDKEPVFEENPELCLEVALSGKVQRESVKNAFHRLLELEARTSHASELLISTFEKFDDLKTPETFNRLWDGCEEHKRLKDVALGNKSQKVAGKETAARLEKLFADFTPEEKFLLLEKYARFLPEEKVDALLLDLYACAPFADFSEMLANLGSFHQVKSPGLLTEIFKKLETVKGGNRERGLAALIECALKSKSPIFNETFLIQVIVNVFIGGEEAVLPKTLEFIVKQIGSHEEPKKVFEARNPLKTGQLLGDLLDETVMVFGLANLVKGEAPQKEHLDALLKLPLAKLEKDYRLFICRQLIKKWEQHGIKIPEKVCDEYSLQLIGLIHTVGDKRTEFQKLPQLIDELKRVAKRDPVKGMAFGPKEKGFVRFVNELKNTFSVNSEKAVKALTATGDFVNDPRNEDLLNFYGGLKELAYKLGRNELNRLPKFEQKVKFLNNFRAKYQNFPFVEGTYHCLLLRLLCEGTPKQNQPLLPLFSYEKIPLALEMILETEVARLGTSISEKQSVALGEVKLFMKLVSLAPIEDHKMLFSKIQMLINLVNQLPKKDQKEVSKEYFEALNPFIESAYSGLLTDDKIKDLFVRIGIQLREIELDFSYGGNFFRFLYSLRGLSQKEMILLLFLVQKDPKIFRWEMPDSKAYPLMVKGLGDVSHSKTNLFELMDKEPSTGLADFDDALRLYFDYSNCLYLLPFDYANLTTEEEAFLNRQLNFESWNSRHAFDFGVGLMDSLFKKPCVGSMVGKDHVVFPEKLNKSELEKGIFWCEKAIACAKVAIKGQAPSRENFVMMTVKVTEFLQHYKNLKKD